MGVMVGGEEANVEDWMTARFERGWRLGVRRQQWLKRDLKKMYVMRKKMREKREKMLRCVMSMIKLQKNWSLRVRNLIRSCTLASAFV